MKKTLTFKTLRGNNYLYSPAKNQFLLCHPIIPFLFLFERNGGDIDAWISSVQKNIIDLPPYGLFPLTEIRHQRKKYRFLKKHHYFDSPPEINLNSKLSPERIIDNITTIKQVIFETTEDCNLSCTYCTYSKFYINKQRGKKKFNIPDAKKTLEYILNKRNPDHKELMISFYGGEPLKNFPFIKEIVEFLESGYKPTFSFKYNLTTNGLLLNRYASFLSKYSFDISISLDGDEKANSFRRLKNDKPSFTHVIRNTDYLKANYPEYFDEKVSFITVLHNKNSQAEVHRFFQSRYGKVPMVSGINTSNVNEQFREEFKQTFLSGISRDDQAPDHMHEMFLRHPVVREIADTLEKYSGFVYRSPRQLLARGSHRFDAKSYLPSATCLPFSIRVFLAADGSILPCEHISRIFEIGQIKNHEVIIDPDAIAMDFNHYFEKIRPLCERCYRADNCKECVFNTRIETGDPFCEYFLDETSFARYFSQQFSTIELDYPLYLRIIDDAFREEK